MNAVNNGPKVPRDPRMGQNTGNMEDFKNLYIPYARTHDSAQSTAYGGEHIIDIHCIFPDFDADVNSPELYDFYLTDGNSNERLVKREFSNTSKTVFYFDMEPNTVMFVKSKDLI